MPCCRIDHGLLFRCISINHSCLRPTWLNWSASTPSRAQFTNHDKARKIRIHFLNKQYVSIWKYSLMNETLFNSFLSKMFTSNYMYSWAKPTSEWLAILLYVDVNGNIRNNSAMQNRKLKMDNSYSLNGPPLYRHVRVENSITYFNSMDYHWRPDVIISSTR